MQLSLYYSLICKIKIPSITFLRPSILLGNRQEFRLRELISKYIIIYFGFLLFGKLKKYRAIHAITVATAMLYIAKENEIGKRVIESDEIKQIVKKY